MTRAIRVAPVAGHVNGRSTTWRSGGRRQGISGERRLAAEPRETRLDARVDDRDPFVVADEGALHGVDRKAFHVGEGELRRSTQRPQSNQRQREENSFHGRSVYFKGGGKFRKFNSVRAEEGLDFLRRRNSHRCDVTAPEAPRAVSNLFCSILSPAWRRSHREGNERFQSAEPIPSDQLRPTAQVAHCL